jgi:hypothetical protein
MANRKELAQLIKVVLRAGWIVEPTKNCHYKWIAPNNSGFFFSSSTPSDKRALERIKQDLRRLGTDVRKLDNTEK